MRTFFEAFINSPPEKFNPSIIITNAASRRFLYCKIHGVVILMTCIFFLVNSDTNGL